MCGTGKRLDGKVAIVTGAGAGIGRASAQLFARHGAVVGILDVDGEAAERCRRDVDSLGGRCAGLQADVRDEEQVRCAIRDIVRRFGRLDILFNNAGGSSVNDSDVGSASSAAFWDTVSLNLFGTWLCCRYGVPEIVRAGGGTVINAASVVALRGVAGRDAYTASKGAIAALTRSMAVEYAAQGVRVNAIAPSTTLTDRIVARLGDDATIAGGQRHLLGFAEAEDIAEVALFLASDESRMITGQVIAADGGYTAG